MQSLIIGLDGNDEKALERRLAVRDAHIVQHQSSLSV